MSADNWALCPRCVDEAERAKLVLADEVKAGYGVLPMEEFDALRLRAEEPVDYEARRTFREDYGIGVQEGGRLVIVYRGRCEVCGLEARHSHDECVYSLTQGG